MFFYLNRVAQETGRCFAYLDLFSLCNKLPFLGCCYKTFTCLSFSCRHLVVPWGSCFGKAPASNDFLGSSLYREGCVLFPFARTSWLKNWVGLNSCLTEPDTASELESSLAVWIQMLLNIWFELDPVCDFSLGSLRWSVLPSLSQSLVDNNSKLSFRSKFKLQTRYYNKSKYHGETNVWIMLSDQPRESIGRSPFHGQAQSHPIFVRKEKVFL